jgi:hypothetical protein
MISPPVDKDERSFNVVLQFTNVSRPAVLLQEPHRIRRDRRHWNSIRHGITPGEEGNQIDNVIAALSQSRQVDRNHVQTIKQVFAKPPGCNLILKIDVCGRDDPHVHSNRASIPDAFEFMFLKNSQQFHLQLVADAVDFIEKIVPP